MRKENIVEYAAVILKLLQGVLYDSDKQHWQQLQTWQLPVMQHFEKIGLELIYDEKEGFAFLHQPEFDEESGIKLPRLIRRMPLSYEQSLLLVILREYLEEQDTRDTYTTRCFITNGEIKERVLVFLKEKANQSRLLRDLDRNINAIVDKLKFLEITREDKVNKENIQYEVKRIIKARVGLAELNQVLAKIQAHEDTVRGGQ